MEANLLADYGSFAELEQACRVLCEQVNDHPRRVTRRARLQMLAEDDYTCIRYPSIRSRWRSEVT
jgi:hypothetical protein